MKFITLVEHTKRNEKTTQGVDSLPYNPGFNSNGKRRWNWKGENFHQPLINFVEYRQNMIITTILFPKPYSVIQNKQNLAKLYSLMPYLWGGDDRADKHMTKITINILCEIKSHCHVELCSHHQVP